MLTKTRGAQTDISVKSYNTGMHLLLVSANWSCGVFFRQKIVAADDFREFQSSVIRALYGPINLSGQPVKGIGLPQI